MLSIDMRPDGAYLQVRVQPKASHDGLRVSSDGRVRVSLTAPPVEDAANRALVTFLAERLGVARRFVAISRGARSRDKSVKISGLSEKDIVERLTEVGS